MSAETTPTTSRNPGPPFGYRFLRACDRLLPEFLFRPLRAFGTWVALAFMPAQRRHSRDYLRHVLPQAPRTLDVFRHFFALEENLMLKLRVADRHDHRVGLAPGSEHFLPTLEAGRPVLLGTMHIGRSDLLGFLLGPRYGKKINMVRLRVGNSHDTDRLSHLFSAHLNIIWVNQPDQLLFALKDAIAAGGHIAMKCDRIEHASRLESFRFLGATRQFPFTIYPLALVFDSPVLLSLGLPDLQNPARSLTHATPPWCPDKTLSKTANLASAHAHFQAFLDLLESQLRQHPYQWFNFLPLNPEQRPKTES